MPTFFKCTISGDVHFINLDLVGEIRHLVESAKPDRPRVTVLLKQKIAVDLVDPDEVEQLMSLIGFPMPMIGSLTV